MFGVLVVVLRPDGIAALRCGSGKLQISLIVSLRIEGDPGLATGGAWRPARRACGR